MENYIKPPRKGHWSILQTFCEMFGREARDGVRSRYVYERLEHSSSYGPANEEPQHIINKKMNGKLQWRFTKRDIVKIIFVTYFSPTKKSIGGNVQDSQLKRNK